uniref:Uncharacterized protein n=1 Tax=Populus alba TaxID=43335 RepID=A0A4U5NR93_POPAL|nr:hypothetical protein D5086_0000239750 [Populus alba]
MEGFPPSSIEEDINMISDELDLHSLLSELELHSLPPEFPDNQSSILCNDQGGQNNVTMTTMGDLDGTSSSWINQNEPNRPQTPSRFLPNPNLLHHNSNIHQPHPGHGYMTPNATTSQHGGFNQPGPSFLPPRFQFLSNQGQVDQAAIIPNIDNMQQENFVPQNYGNSTRALMDNLQVRGLQNQTARPNASNPGIDTSLQSQIRGLNTQQVRSLTELSSSFFLYDCAIK